DEVLKEVLTSVKEGVKSYGSREHAFGCTLFGNKDISAFESGPVRFETRNDWLKRKQASGEVTEITARRVRKSWKGEKPRKRKLSNDEIRENDIIAAIGTCPFVCSVQTDGLSAEAG